MTLDTVSILDGNEFVVGNRQGDLEATPTVNHGLFLDDTRFLSRWVLTINGQRPIVLSVDDTSYYRVQHFMALATGEVYIDSHLSVARQRSVGGGFNEVLLIVNHGVAPVDLDIRIEVAADFADLFEVKDKRPKKGELYRQVADNRLTLGYRRDQYRRETWVTSSEPAQITEEALSYSVRLEPRSIWLTHLDVIAVRQPEHGPPPAPNRSPEGLRPELAESLPAGSRTPRTWSRPGSRWSRSMNAVSSISPRFASGPPWCSARCRRRACPGSWRSSAGTVC
jgi:hypothetical protein